MTLRGSPMGLSNGNGCLDVDQEFSEEFLQNPQNEEERKIIRENYRKLVQNEEERKIIRENYRLFQDELNEKREELINPSDEQDLLVKNVEKVDKMFENVQMTREGALDSASLVNLSDLGKTKAQALKTNFLIFNPTDFCEKVRTLIAGAANTSFSREKWATLGNAVTPFFARAPVLRYMCGTFDKGEVTLKQPRRVAKEKDKETEAIEKASRPTQLSSFDQTERGELTTAQVEHLLSTLWNIFEKNENVPVCYFEFVTNPYSFGQTVENMFYVSFLVRDGHAKIYLDSENLPVIEPIQKDEQEATQTTSRKSQLIVSITPSEWEEIVRVFNIEEPVIKPIGIEKKELSIKVNQSSYEGKGKGKAKKSK